MPETIQSIPQKKDNKTLYIILFLLLLGVGAFTSQIFVGNRDTDKSIAQLTPTGNTTGTPIADTPVLIWQQTEAGWQATKTPPKCSNQPMFISPVDLTRVTSILYPGQIRGGNYKPHGGFRFDANKDNSVLVVAPIEGFVVRGGNYLAEGEVQYTIDVMNNCGVMYRIGHVRELSPALKKLAETWPAPVEGDSRTQSVNPALYIKKGETIATKVGITKNKNVFVDWGVYDYRQQNNASKSTAYQVKHASDKELSWYAVCWFNWVGKDESNLIKALPAADPTSKKSSDYCTNL